MSSTQVGHFKVRKIGWGWGGWGLQLNQKQGPQSGGSHGGVTSQVVVGVGSGRCKNVSVRKSTESQ